MPTPNLFLTYVTDVERSTAFYRDLFGIEPEMITPRYVPFEIAPGMLFAVWSGHSEVAAASTPRTSEVGIMLPGGADAIDRTHDEWRARGVTIVEAPYDEPFGRTFVAADPDGNLIRVSPTD